MKPKPFTIIICTYNSELRLVRTINKILEQNCFNELVEDFIVVNNNSNDSTQQIINSYQGLIKPIFESKPGVSYARLAGAKAASTPWLVYIDDDNFLEQNWLIETKAFIDKNPTIGAFNGAVIPLFEDTLTKEEQERLEIVFRRLACSHLTREQISNVNNHIPIGAGLVVKNQPIQQLINAGWTKRTGRLGKRLLGGEDIEMTLFVKAQGFEWGFCPTMVIQHLLSKARLDEEYLVDLYKNNDIELELRSARFGRFASIYLISESLFFLAKYHLTKINPISSRKSLFDVRLKMEQGFNYLKGLLQGKKLPETIKSLGQAHSIGYRSHS